MSSRSDHALSKAIFQQTIFRIVNNKFFTDFKTVLESSTHSNYYEIAKTFSFFNRTDDELMKIFVDVFLETNSAVTTILGMAKKIEKEHSLFRKSQSILKIIRLGEEMLKPYVKEPIFR
jgi:predicted transcriptional regulator